MRTLLIGLKERELIKCAIERAMDKPLPWEVTKRIAIAGHIGTLDLKDRPIGFRPKAQSVDLPRGFRCYFCFEQQPTGVYRHLSVSVDNPKKIPHPAAMDMIAKEFGLSGFPPNETGKIWREEFEPGHYAVNVIELAP